MTAALPAFSVPAYLAHLRAKGCALGEPFHYFAATGSTNDEARQAGRSGALSGCVFLADMQTEGRGRRGRSWFAPVASGLWFTVLYRPRLALSEIAPLTLAVGLAVRQALSREIGIELGLKWPNDIEINGRKLAGILVESEFVAGTAPALAIGIGINTCVTFPDDSLPNAASLHEFGAPSSREELLVSVLEALANGLQRFGQRGIHVLLDELRAHDALLGKRIVVDGKAGVAAGFDDRGYLLLQTEQGTLALNAGSVERG